MTDPNYRLSEDGSLYSDYTNRFSEDQVRRFVYLKKDHLRRALQVADDLHDDLRLWYGVLEAVDGDDARRHLGDGFYVQEAWLNTETEQETDEALGRWRCVESLLHRGWPGSEEATP